MTSKSEGTLTNRDRWRTRTYLTWTAVGTGIGAIAAYLYTRAADENAVEQGVENDDDPPVLGTGEIITIALGALTLIRQLAESGRSKRRRK